MSDSNKYNEEIELKIAKLFDSSIINDSTIDLDLIYSNVKYIKDTFIEKCSQNTIKKFIRFSVNYIEYSHKTLSNDLKNYERQNDRYNDVKNRIGKVLIIFEFVDVIARLSEKSYEFSELFHDTEGQNGIKVLLDFIKDEKVASQLLNKINENFFVNLFKYLLSCYVAALLNLSKVYDKYNEIWKNLDAFATVLELTKNYENKKNNLRFVMTLANIASPEDLNVLSGEIRLFELLTDNITLFANALSDESFFISKQFKRDFYKIEKDRQKFEVIKENGGNNLIEALQSLFKFTVDDKLKYLFYETLCTRDSLKIIIYRGNEIEQEYAAKVLNQLCFHKNISEDVNNDKHLIKFMVDIVAKKKHTNKTLVKNISNILWLANYDSNKPTKIQKNNEIRHIFISYEDENKDSCIKIKTFLESLGYKCWINMYQEPLEIITEAIETSWCVLICMSEKYKVNNNCRIEAEYALQLDKPFVTLVLQDLYTPDGW